MPFLEISTPSVTGLKGYLGPLDHHGLWLHDKGMDESLRLELSRLKLAYLTRDWSEVAAVIKWLTSRGYLNATQHSVSGNKLDREELRRRREYSRMAADMGLWGLTVAYRQRDWDRINRIMQWLQVRGHIQ